MKSNEVIRVQAGQDRSAEFGLCTHVCLCLSMNDAEKFMTTYSSSFPDSGRLLLLVLGLVPEKKAITRMNRWLKNKKVLLAMPDDLAGHVAAIKISCFLKGRSVSLSALPEGRIQITFRGQTFIIPAQLISLNRFEKESGFRSLIRVYKLKL